MFHVDHGRISDVTVSGGVFQAKTLEEMDAAFGVGSLVEQELGGPSKVGIHVCVCSVGGF